MDREQIISGTSFLPKIPAGKIPEDHEIFEGDDAGAHFKFTKNKADSPQGIISFNMLSVSGVNEAKERIIKDFIEVFGEPTEQETSRWRLDLELVTWFIGINPDFDLRKN